MENPEEDAGSLADASRLATARERNIGQREDNAMSECSGNRAASPMLDLTTETLLHMIDELVDEPRVQEVPVVAALTTTPAIASETNINSSSSISTVTSSKLEKCDLINETSHQTNSEPPKQVPKLTIKLSGTQQTVIPNSSHKFNEVYSKSSSSEVSESDSSENDECPSTSEQVQTSSKLISESVPKVTIKLGKPGTECEGKFYAQQNVPKLTIKTHDLESEEESVTKIKLKSSKQDETSPEKIPKLTIKTIMKPDNQQLSPKLLIKPISKVENQQLSPKLTIKPIPKPENQQLSPKLTIKPIPKPENQLSPKLTIKPIKPPDYSEEFETHQIPKLKISQDYISLRECNDSAQVPKITIKPIFKAECETNQKNLKKGVSSRCDDNEHIPVVTKLNIKPIQKPVESESSSEYSNHSSDEKLHVVSKLNIKPILKPKDDEKNHAEASIPKITKLNIKPIIDPDDPCTETKTCETWSSFDKSIPVITKLNIKPVIEPSYDETSETSKDSENQSSETGNSSDENTEQIPNVTKINIKPIVKPCYTEPLTIRPIPLDESTVPVVTKLNIKPVLKPEENTPQASPKKSLHGSPDYIPLVTKLHIKPVINPDQCEIKKENQRGDSPKNPPLLMKIRTKPDNSGSCSEIQINKLVSSLEYELCNNSNDGPTAVYKNSPKSYLETNNEIQRDIVNQLKSDEKCIVKRCKEVSPTQEKVTCVPTHIENDINSILLPTPDKISADTVAMPTYIQSNERTTDSLEHGQKSVAVEQDTLNQLNTKSKIQNCISNNENLERINAHNAGDNGISDPILDQPLQEADLNYKNLDCCTEPNAEHTFVKTLSDTSDIKAPSIIIQNDTTPECDSNKLNVTKKKLPQKRRRKGASSQGLPPKRLPSSRIAAKKQQVDLTNDREDLAAPESSPHETSRSTLSELLTNKPLLHSLTTGTDSYQDHVKPQHENSNFESMTADCRNDLHSFLPAIQEKPPPLETASQKIVNWSGTNAIEPHSNEASTASSDVLDITQIIDSGSQDKVMILNDSSTCDYKSSISSLSSLNKKNLEINDNLEQDKLDKPQPRKRGRPRKKLPPEGEPLPVTSTPAVKERPQRSLRLTSGTPTAKRSPRKQRRGTGVPNSSNSPFEQLSAKLDKSIEISDKPVEGNVGTHLDIDPTSSTVKLPRMTEVLNKMPNVMLLSRRKSGMDSECSRSLDGSPDTAGENVVRPRTGKGSRGGRGRVQRGVRRARGGGRGAVYMKETMGIYGRVCGPATTTIELLEEETCMMDDNASQAKPNLMMDEDSQSSVKSSTNDSSKGKKPRIDFFDSSKQSTAALVREYHWTHGGTSKMFMIQEQVALFLGVRSFNQQYPQLKRRKIAGEELMFLQSEGLVSSSISDEELTAVDASEILDIMLSDYPHKYEEFRSHQRQRERFGIVTRTPSAHPPPDHIELLKPVETKIEPPKIDPEKLRQETAAQARASVAEYNARLNMQRFKTCTDLQNMLVHRRTMIPPTPSVTSVPSCGLYPLALLPGQYQHSYATYTSEQLRYFPLNTALTAPPPPVQPVYTDTESDAEWCLMMSSDEETDNDASSSVKRMKVSSSKHLSLGAGGMKEESSESTSRTGSQSAWTDAVDTCRMCGLREEANRKYSHERFLCCSRCSSKMHPSCLELSADTIRKCRDYPWQCAECKTCYGCHLPADDDKMLFCDLCDRGFHIYCVGLDEVPSGRWHCEECAICKSCGARDAAGLAQADASGSTPEWHHQSKRGAGGHKVYSHSLCTPCARKSKMGHRTNANSKTCHVEESSWDAGKNAYRIGRYCPLCDRSFIGPKGTMQLVICKLCDRQLHQECVKQTVSNLNILDYTCADCRRGGITSRAAAARLAPRTIATLFMAKRRFNKYAHRQYIRSKQKDKEQEDREQEDKEQEDKEQEDKEEEDKEQELVSTPTPDADPMDADEDPDMPNDSVLSADMSIDIDAYLPTDLDSLPELTSDNLRAMDIDELPSEDLDETANAVKSLQLDFD